jgi:putative transcriptional regulator
MLDKQTMRRFDASCLTPIKEFTAEEIPELREREQVSKADGVRTLS